MQAKQRMASLSQREVRPQDGIWLNDTGTIPLAHSHYTVANDSSSVAPSQCETRPFVTEAPLTNYIGPEHALWPVIRRFSERIWRELHADADKALLPRLALATLVRERAIALLRSEPGTAVRIRDLAEATVVLHSIVCEVAGYGPLEALLRDESVREVVALGPYRTFVERAGRTEEVASRFADEQHMLRIIKNLLRHSDLSGQIGWSIAEVRLQDGSLVTVTMPPNAANGPTLTICKSARKQLVITDLVTCGSLSQPMASLLLACVQARLNVVICGGVGAGKTTLLNALGLCISAQERIITIEESTEIQLDQRQVVSLVTHGRVHKNTEPVTMRDLLLHAQRMKPGRIIVGECRSNVAAELLQAMDSGYDGVLTTMHAHTVQDCLMRFETLCRAGGIRGADMLLPAQIARSLDVIVHVTKLRDGSRKITHIAEVLDGEDEHVRIQSIFRYREEGLDNATGNVRGFFEASGLYPTFLTKFKALDVHLPLQLFVPRRIASSALR